MVYKRRARDTRLKNARFQFAVDGDFFLLAGVFYRAAARRRYDIMKSFIREHCKDEKFYAALCSRIDFDKALHFGASRRMEAVHTFDFGSGLLTFRIDYSRRNPVNGEAAFTEKI